MSTNNEERIEFAARLTKACGNAGIKQIGPTKLQREFNLRSPKSITPHAARKWIVGESIPTQDKLRTLAAWLQVTPDWLRYGALDGKNPENTVSQGISDKDSRSLYDLSLLTKGNRMIADEMIKVLLRTQKPDVKK